MRAARRRAEPRSLDVAAASRARSRARRPARPTWSACGCRRSTTRGGPRSAPGAVSVEEPRGCAGTAADGSVTTARGVDRPGAPVSVATITAARSSVAGKPRWCIRCRNTVSTSSTPSRRDRRVDLRCPAAPRVEVDGVDRWSRAAAGAARTARSPLVEREVPAGRVRVGGPEHLVEVLGLAGVPLAHHPRPARARLVVLLDGPPARSRRWWPPRRARCRGGRPGRTPSSPGSSARGARMSVLATATANAPRPRRTARRSRRRPWSSPASSPRPTIMALRLRCSRVTVSPVTR